MNIEELRRKAQFGESGIVYVGYGKKIRNGVDTGKTAIRVGVRVKLPLSALEEKDLIPLYVGYLPTDVVESGEFHMPPTIAVEKRSSARIAEPPGIDRTEKHRPIFGGISIGHYHVTAGTLGVILDLNGQPVIITNNHVGANVNEAEIGDPWYQPGVYDGGDAQDEAAYLLWYEPIKTVGGAVSDCGIANGICSACNWLAKLLRKDSRLFSATLDVPVNVIDVALGRPIVDFSYGIHILVEDARNLEIEDPGIDDVMVKSGRTTAITQGKVVATDVTMNVNMGTDMAVFEHQFITEAMSSGGDSGSVTLKKSADGSKLSLSGLLFAGSDMETAHNLFSEIAKAIGYDRPVFATQALSE